MLHIKNVSSNTPKITLSFAGLNKKYCCESENFKLLVENWKVLMCFVSCPVAKCALREQTLTFIQGVSLVGVKREWGKSQNSCAAVRSCDSSSRAIDSLSAHWRTYLLALPPPSRVTPTTATPSIKGSACSRTAHSSSMSHTQNRKYEEDL